MGLALRHESNGKQEPGGPRHPNPKGKGNQSRKNPFIRWLGTRSGIS